MTIEMTIVEQAKFYGCTITIGVDPSTHKIYISLIKGECSATYDFPDDVCLSYNSINTCIKNFIKTIKEVNEIPKACWVVPEGWSIKENGNIEGVVCSNCGYVHPPVRCFPTNMLKVCPHCNREMTT